SPTRSATLNANSISFNLTPKWRFATTLGYDFIQKELTPSQFNLNRSLECWDLSFQISPFGDFQYYFFRLSVNSAQIQTLFQKLPILKNLERSSSPTGGSIYN
ncbi:MAG: LPS-assembly protein LptD, partial [Balneolaceae bacterium]